LIPAKKRRRKKRKGEVNNKICYTREYIQRAVGSDEDLSLPSFPDVAISREAKRGKETDNWGAVSIYKDSRTWGLGR